MAKSVGLYTLSRRAPQFIKGYCTLFRNMSYQTITEIVPKNVISFDGFAREHATTRDYCPIYINVGSMRTYIISGEKIKDYANLDKSLLFPYSKSGIPKKFIDVYKPNLRKGENTNILEYGSLFDFDVTKDKFLYRISLSSVNITREVFSTIVDFENEEDYFTLFIESGSKQSGSTQSGSGLYIQYGKGRWKLHIHPMYSNSSVAISVYTLDPQTTKSKNYPITTLDKTDVSVSDKANTLTVSRLGDILLV